MSASSARPSGHGLRSFEVGPVLTLLGACTALSVALAVGNPTTDLRMVAVAMMGALAMAGAMLWPFTAFLVVVGSCILLIAWVVTDNRAVNPIDVLLLPLFAISFFGVARRRALDEDAALVGPIHEAIRRATRRLTRATIAFYAIAASSLVILSVRGHASWALDSALLLVRAVQGLSLFALGMWWLRSEGRIRAALGAVQVGAWSLVVVNLWHFDSTHIPRAGMTWVANQPEWPITSPNEAAVTLLVVIALLQSRPREWRGRTHLLLATISLVMLVLTQSRSGLLAWIVYALLSIRWRWSTVFRAALLAAVAAPLVPESYWGRVGRTLSPTSPSFETFGSIIRLYTWETAAKVFLDNPIFGIGYMGFRFVSATYNEMRLVLNTVENFYFEVTTSMGLVGLIAMVAVFAALLRLDAPIRASAAPGSMGQGMARLHRPLVLALMAANLTGNNFMGMVGLGQLAIWCALLVRAGHLSVARPDRITAG